MDNQGTNYYKQFGIRDLREHGRTIGVKSPTTLKKVDLINEIVAIESGEKAPFYTNMGRPCYKTFNGESIRADREEKLRKIDELAEEFLTKVREIVLKM